MHKSEIIKRLVEEQRFNPDDLYRALFPTSKMEGLDKIYQYALSLSFKSSVEYRFDEETIKMAQDFLISYRQICIAEKLGNYDTFLSQYPFDLLDEVEINNLEDSLEYRLFERAFNDEYVYEMMKLNRSVTKHSTIDHIAGVHYLAMYIARQLQSCGIPIDLGRVSGAAAGHDIGKFGTKSDEEHRVAYYHYYYTDQWFRERDIEYIRNIAVNHSTWDLELDNLSVESLVLIYSDFRVKSSRNSKFKMSYYSLDDAFQVILDKLDNVDFEKENRYRKVYEKLKNFENYMTHMGINTAFEKRIQPAQNKEVCIAQGDEIVNLWIDYVIDHNIRTMDLLRTNESLISLIEEARGEDNRLKFRRYIDILSAYYLYMIPEQKILTIHFLLENLIHIEEDIRKGSSELIGKIILSYDETYKKETPPNSDAIKVIYTKYDLIAMVIDYFFDFDSTVSSKKIQRIGRAVAQVIHVCLLQEDYGKEILQYVFEKIQNESITFEEQQVVLDILLALPKELLDEVDIIGIKTYLLKQINSPSILIKHFAKHVANHFSIVIEDECDWNNRETKEIFLLNLKTNTPWIDKIYHIDRLFNDEEDKFYTALHFCNLIKVSEDERVRNYAGGKLLLLTERFENEKRNDIVVELLRALELDSYQFSKFIPQYLGPMMVQLNDCEYDEVVSDFRDKLKTSSPYLRALLLRTIGVMIVEIFKNMPSRKPNLGKLYGLLMIGLATRNGLTNHIALEVLGREILGNDALDLKDRALIFTAVSKKTLVLIDHFDNENPYLTGMIDIYRMISDYQHMIGKLEIPYRSKVAYFSGTFDPFSRGQKSVAEKVVDLGMEVYIALDEFNWKRRTQPSELRRNIIEMSTAENLNMFLFPKRYPINLIQERSLKQLDDLFRNREVYIVAGEDLIASHLAYADEKHPIYSYKHLIIERHSHKKTNHRLDKLDYQVLKIDMSLERMGSAHIRKYVAKHWDLSDLIDELGQELIREQHMYQGEPEFKHQVKSRRIDVKYGDDTIMIEDIRTRSILGKLKFRIKNKIMHIEELTGKLEEQLHDMRISILTESFVWAINNGLKGAVAAISEEDSEIFEMFGFVKKNEHFEVSFIEPMLLEMDAQSMLKEDYRNHPYIRSELLISRKRMIHKINQLFPGKLLLLMDHTFMYEHILKILERINPAKEDEIGDKLIVPYGALFNRWILPHAITKSLHIERCFTQTTDSFKILAHPNYLKVDEQVNVISEFNRPVILIDDLLHKGYRLKDLMTYFEDKKVALDSVVVGILTDSGEEVIKPLKVHSAYRLKNITAWFVESQMMPYIGGETLLKDKWPKGAALPSVNKILPYMYVDIPELLDKKLFYSMSLEILEATQEFMEKIESIYLETHGEKLILSNLNEIVTQPRYPESNSRTKTDGKLLPSKLIFEDAEFLKRFKKLFM